MVRVVAAAVLVAALSSTALATSYASGVSYDGNTLTYTLNQDAANVTIQTDGGPVSGPLTKGTHSVVVGSTVDWNVNVGSAAASGWTQFSDDALTQSKYYSPRGVTVDTNPMRSTFGQIFVGEGLGGAVGAGGRTTTDGIYIMSADQGDVTGQGDSAYGGGIDWSTGGSSSPFKLGLNRSDPTGQDYNIYMSDWSDSHSGIWTASATNPSAAFYPLLDNTGRGAGGLVLENNGAGPGELHGSVPCGPWVEGVGANRKMYTIDEDVRRGNILQYDIGTTTSNYNVAPTDRVSNDSGHLLNGLMDVVRDESGGWWIAQYRYTDSDAVPALSYWADGASSPSWTSGTSTIPFDLAYGSIDIHDELGLLAMGTRGGTILILDINDPANPVLVDTIIHSGSYIRDVAFDAVGNVYAVSSSSETLRIYSPGGDWIASTGSDGSFTLVPEPASLLLLALGAFVLRRR